MNIFYFDVETSGLDPNRHGILQIAWIIEVDGEMKLRQCFDVQPCGDVDLSLAALSVNDFTLERIKSGAHPSVVLQAMETDLITHRGGQPYYPCAYNAPFDISFLRELCDRLRDNTVMHYVDFKRTLDPLAILRYMDFKGMVNLDNYKLSSACRHFNIDIDPHDAASDITATRELFHKLKDLI